MHRLFYARHTLLLNCKKVQLSRRTHYTKTTTQLKMFFHQLLHVSNYFSNNAFAVAVQFLIKEFHETPCSVAFLDVMLESWWGQN